MKWLKKISKDAACTLGGITAAALNGAASAYLNGGIPSKEAVIASAAMGVAGWWLKRGDKTPVIAQ